MATTKEQVIVEIWEKTTKDLVEASDLTLINAALRERFGSESSPASIARVLADQGARLGHPEILQADSRWRDQQHLFSPAEIAFDTIHSANIFIDKLEQLRKSHNQQSLRQSVQQIKQELDLLAARHAVAREAAQWLTVWLQNPKIFAEWLDLRRSTNEFEELFGTFPSPQANTNDHRA